jgi:hypothetical protein
MHGQIDGGAVRTDPSITHPERADKNELWLILTWIASLLVGTYLGSDRGRWAEGVCLSLLFGPLGALAAGLLTPSYEWDARRRYGLHNEFERLGREETARRRQRREEQAVFDSLVQTLENHLRLREESLADQLQQLAEDLEALVVADPSKEEKVRKWIAWLSHRAQLARAHEEGLP